MGKCVHIADTPNFICDWKHFKFFFFFFEGNLKKIFCLKTDRYPVTACSHTHTHTNTEKVLFSGINIQTRTGARSPLRLSWWCAGQMAEPHTHHNPHTQHGRVFLSIWGKIKKKKKTFFGLPPPSRVYSCRRCEGNSSSRWWESIKLGRV